MFVPGKPFKPNLMFVSKAGNYLSEAPFKCYTLGSAPCLTQNIRLGWKILPGKNTRAYYKNSKITNVKGFITDTWAQCYKTFYILNLRIIVIS